MSDQTYFAQIDQDNRVLNIIVASQEVVDSGALGDPAEWIQTWREAENNPRGSMAEIDGFYCPDPDRFAHRRPFPSWSLDWSTAEWVPPVPKPTEPGDWVWDEETQSWIINPNPITAV